jgi:hypothetical protein
VARTFRLTPPEPLEQDVHEALARTLNQLLAPPAFWFSAGIGATKLAPHQAAKLTRAGVRRGLPDFFILYAGLVFSIELKARKGRLSKTRVTRTKSGAPRVLEGQEEVFPKLRAAGVAVVICRSVDEALDQIKRWGIPLRGRISA